jgi:hypothetical protein
MEPTQVAELIVHNGRLAGTRQPLPGPLAFLGGSAGADIRVHGDGVNPLHCLIARNAAGFVVRDLETDSGTFVNGQRVATAQLRPGDALTLGTMQFKFVILEAGAESAPLPAPLTVPDLEAHEDALRIQAAAVAAQQAALLEEESRLQQQQGALNQQQDQLAAHLEDKRQRLVQLGEQVQASRAALHRERAELDRQATRQAEELATHQVALDSDRKKLQAQRQRADGLRRRLTRRFQRRLLAERQQFQQCQQAAQTERQRLQQEWDKLKKERDSLTQARMICNGDAELGKRQLQAEWEKLWQEVKSWNQDREQKEADLAGRARTSRHREDALKDAERALGDDRHQWVQKRKLLEQEVQGLEKRLVSRRHKLNELQAQLQRAEAKTRDARGEPVPMAILIEDDPRYLEPLLAAPASPGEAHLRELEAQIKGRVACLDTIAEDLADQRLELAEHWQRVAQTQAQWLQTHGATLADLEALAAGVPLKEHALLARQDALETAEGNLRRRQQELAQLRQHLEAWAARVRIREENWESERDRVLIDVQGREALAEKQVAAVVALRQRWAQRRRHELELLRAERAACEQLRQQQAQLRQHCWKRSLALEQQERDLAEKTLAIEEYRQQFILRSQDAAGAENKLERIRKRWMQENAATMRSTTEQFQRMQQESEQVHERGRELLKVAEELTQREAALAQRQAAWEEQLMQAEAHAARLQQQLQSVQVQRERGDRQVAELQNEIERLARVLLDECDPAPPQSLAA